MEDRILENIGKKRIRLIMVIIWVTLFFGGFSLFKLMTTLGAIMADFKIEYGLAGIMNTEVSWAALILMVPMGYVAAKAAPRWTILGTGVLMGLGGILTSVAANFAVFTIGRIIEGGALALMSMIAYSLAANLTKKYRSLALGTMISAAMVAQAVLLIFSSRVLESGVSWRTLYLVIGIAQLVMMLLWLIVCPKDLKISGISPTVKPTKEQTRRVYKTPSLWFSSIATGIFLGAIVSTSTYIPTYITTRGLDLVQASTVFAIASLIGLFASSIWGIISDKLHTKRKIAAFSSVSAALCFVLLMVLPVNALIVFSILFGFLPRSVIGLSYASTPDLVENPADVPVANATREIISRVVSIGIGVLVGFVIQNAGYTVMFSALSVAMVIAGVLWLSAKKIP
jgi:predicted MFS family arabinose efflux permease